MNKKKIRILFWPFNTAIKFKKPNRISERELKHAIILKLTNYDFFYYKNQ